MINILFSIDNKLGEKIMSNYSNNTIKEENRYKESNRISLITIIGNIILTIVKLVAGIISNSTAMIADAVHSGSDIISTVAVMIGMNISEKPADREHPYGHEKAESIMAKILALLLFITALGIGVAAVKTILSGDIRVPGTFALYAAVLSIGVKEWMYRITINTADKIKSTSMKADAWHHRSDAISSIAALIGIAGARLGIPVLDPIAGLSVAVFIIKISFDIYMQAVKELMDTAASPEVIDKILRTIAGVDGVMNIHAINTRMHGARIYVDIKICVNRFLSVYEGHDISHKVKDAIMENVDDVKNVLVHVNPCFNTDDEGNKTLECERCDKKNSFGYNLRNFRKYMSK